MAKTTPKQRRLRRQSKRRTTSSGAGEGTDGLGGAKWKAVPEELRDPLRFFTWWMKHKIWENQAGRCARTGVALHWKTVEFDHVIPWAAGGRTSIENGEALSPSAHLKKSRREKVKQSWGGS